MYPSKTSPFYGIFVETFVENMQANGVEVSAKALIKGDHTSYFSKTIKYFKFFLQVYSGLLKSDYDVIYVHYAEHSLLPLWPVYLFLGKKLVVNAHGDDIRHDSFISSLVEPIIKQADMLVVPSQYFLEFAKSKNLNDNIFVSPSGGIDTQKFRQLHSQKSENVFVIGLVSRIDKEKGWDTLIRAYEKLQHLIPEIELIIIGKGDEVGKMLRLKEKVDTKKGIQYLGAIPNKELVSYYNRFDLFIFPTERLAESLGVVALEALSCGVPIVGSNIGPVKEYITDGQNGFLFEPGNAADLADKVQLFYNLGKEKKAEFTKSALITAKNYDSKVVTKQLKEQLKKVVQI